MDESQVTRTWLICLTIIILIMCFSLMRQGIQVVKWKEDFARLDPYDVSNPDYWVNKQGLQAYRQDRTEKYYDTSFYGVDKTQGLGARLTDTEYNPVIYSNATDAIKRLEATNYAEPANKAPLNETQNETLLNTVQSPLPEESINPEGVSDEAILTGSNARIAETGEQNVELDKQNELTQSIQTATMEGFFRR